MSYPMDWKTSRGPETINQCPESKLPLTVAEVMTRDVVTVSPHQSLSDAISLISANHFHHIVVIDSSAKVVGVVSDRDILRAVARTPDWHTYNMGQVMTANPITVRPESPLLVAVSKMLAKRFNSLPVVGENGTLTGILTSTDVLWCYQKLTESMQARLEQIGFDKLSLSI